MGRVIIIDEYYDITEPTVEIAKRFNDCWFDTSGYTEVLIYYFDYNSKKAKPLLLSYLDFSKARLWMEKQLEGEVIVKHRVISDDTQIYAYFQNNSDAVAFKLTWLGSNNDRP